MSVVSQGNHLGPLGFGLFVNDLPFIILHSKIPRHIYMSLYYFYTLAEGIIILTRSVNVNILNYGDELRRYSHVRLSICMQEKNNFYQVLSR